MTSKCPDPGQPRNGLRTPAKSLFYHGESARFQCISNYTLLGKSILTCQQNGTWNGIQPSCLAPCSDPVAPHLVRLDNDFQHGKTVRLKCKQRYTLVGSRRILCHNGKWFPMIPECKAPCADPGIPIGGIRLYNKSVYISERSVNAELFGYFGYFKHKTVLRFECTHLYWTLEGEKFLTCNDGQWNNVAPRCIHQFETVGCYKDSHIRSILSMRIGHFSNYRKNTISRKDFNDTISVCGLTALQMKCSVFGIQENGDCWCTHKDVSKLPLRYGKSNDCYQGVGTQRAIMVYSFKSLLKAGCFPANSLVELKTGDIVTMETLRIGDKVKTLELSTNKIFYTDVITFFHNEEIQRLLYCVITTENGNKLLISHKHLIYSGKTKDTMNMIYAANIQPGDFVLTGNRTLKVVSVMTMYDRGVYAPMTRHGTLLVNGIYVSSYAHHDSHELLHILVTPLRLWYDLSNFLRRVLAVIGVNLASNNGLTGTEMPQGIHGYIRFYMAMSEYFP